MGNDKEGACMTEDCNWKPLKTVNETVTALKALETLDSLIRPEYYGTRVIF